MRTRAQHTALMFELNYEMHTLVQSLAQLENWGIDLAHEIKTLPKREQQFLRGTYLTRKRQLETQNDE